MNPLQANAAPQADRYPEIADRLPRSISETEGLVQELNQKMAVLPGLDLSGDSECPFAGRLYQAMMAAADRLRACLRHLRENESIVREERVRREQQKARIRADMQRLHTDGPRAAYEQALTAQKQRCHEIEDLLERLQSTIERAEQALSESAQCPVPSRGYETGPSYLRTALPPPLPVRESEFGEQFENTGYTLPDAQPLDGSGGPSLGPALDGLIGIGPVDPSAYGFGSLGD